MKILVIESSPHKKGSSNLLASELIRGAREAGHTVRIFDAAHAKIAPCLGCNACRTSGACVQKDDMVTLCDDILRADMVVFVTPLYYYGMSAQLKIAIDRFYAITTQLGAKKLKAALIVAAWDNESWTMQDVKAHYETLCRYLNFTNMGEILGVGCGSVSATAATAFPQAAYDLGRSL